MNIIVFNCGSSSLKYRVLSMPDETEIAGGEAQRVGPPTSEPSTIFHRFKGMKSTHTVPMRNHFAAFGEVMKLISAERESAPDAAAHRIVHGGSVFRSPVILDRTAVSRLESIKELAPIHNPPATELIHACRTIRPGLPQVAVFDTAFHSTIPDYACTYALPARLRTTYGIRKYGFHGTSHQFVAEEAAKHLAIPFTAFNAVSCHLGSGGASLCAIAGGKSRDNTMGYSPLQGLVMSTRSGDLDPAIAMNLLYYHGGDADRVEKILNNKSGILGLSGFSADVRDLLADSSKNQRVESALDVYLWRLKKYLGAYLATVTNAHAVIFTDTIGETVPGVRWAMCSGMEAFGLEIDPVRNKTTDALPAEISTNGSDVRILVVATNEELAIARQSHRLLDRLAKKGCTGKEVAA
jgi:acetate kinase